MGILNNIYKDGIMARDRLLPHQAVHLRGLRPIAGVRPVARHQHGSMKKFPLPESTSKRITASKLILPKIFIVSVVYLMPLIYFAISCHSHTYRQMFRIMKYIITN